jgi:hypothetical protein
MEVYSLTDDTKRAEVHEAIARLEAMAAERGNEERSDIKDALSTLRYHLTLLMRAKSRPWRGATKTWISMELASVSPVLLDSPPR